MSSRNPTPIPTFPLRGKEAVLTPLFKIKHLFSLRGNKVGVGSPAWFC